jgi:hypothetical protein
MSLSLSSKFMAVNQWYNHHQHRPDIVEVLANQTQLLQRMVEVVERRINGENFQGPQEEDLMQKIERFIRLKPPTFSCSDDPLDADDWLRVIETKLDLTNYTDEECVAIATHQLKGSAKSWWDNYSDFHPVTYRKFE